VSKKVSSFKRRRLARRRRYLVFRNGRWFSKNSVSGPRGKRVYKLGGGH